MKRRIVFCAALVAIFTTIIASCGKDPDTSLNPQALHFQAPEDWPVPFYTFLGNPVTRDGFALGKKLFYDTRLSRTHTISCGSCHQPFAAFAHLDHDISHGVEDRVGTRNSPPLFNLAWSTSFFWDGGVNHIEVQPLAPLQNPVEMDIRTDTAANRVAADPVYRDLFQRVYGTPEVTSARMFKAMAQFMGMMVSANSKYDRNAKGIAGNEFTASEQAGKEIFESKCATCHKPPLFTDFSFRNNGLTRSIVKDSGRTVITKDVADLYKFKVPSLRNLEFTRPYMHDGRFRTLEQVLDHYDHGISQDASLDPSLQGGIPLNAQQRTDLLAFLATLNDVSFTEDKRFHQ